MATNAGTVEASYATGDVTITATSDARGGGLLSYNQGTVTAAYATGSVSATTGVTAYAGGLVGENLGTITAAWSGGSVTATATTVNRGGLVGAGSGTVTNAYWDTDTSGIPDDADTNAPEGKTSSELQTPTAYGTGSSLYANWNVNVDGVSGNDDPWDFGTASQWPVLHVRTLPYVLLTPPTVTWALGNATIYESTTGGSTRATSTTITPTLSAEWPTDLSFIFPTDAAVYTLSNTSMTIPAGATTVTGITLTAVNNFKCGNVDCAGSNASDATVSLSPSSNHLRMSTTVPNITITDDDILVKPTGVKLSVTGTKVRVDWTQVSGATGYIVQWNISDTWTGALAGTATITSGSTTNHTITSGLTSGVTYFFRVIATKTGNDNSAPSDSVSNTPKTGNVDYDSDNDGLIEVNSLARLNAIRWDLDGDGEVDNASDATAYSTAFPDAEANMGCSESVVTVSSNDTGNPTCKGYELDAALDFDTNGSGGPNSGDTYWNSGAGWLPIGATAGSATASAYTGEFDGGTHVISNLYVNRSGSTAVGLAGLFAELGSGAKVSNLKLKGVSVTSATNSSASTGADVYAGGVAGKSAGSVTGSYVIGTVKATQSDISGNTTEENAYAGGLVGHSTGSVTSSYARATATAEQKSPTASKNAYAGGLAGYQGAGGAINASFTTGTVTALSESATGAKSYAGGLVGHQAAGSVKASYSHAHPEARTTASATTATLAAGGLAGLVASGASVTASYSTGAPATSGGSSPTTQVGGLAGSSSGTIANSYWDTATSGVTATGAGTGKTTSELKTPTTYGTGIAVYAAWNIDVGGSASVDDPWDFGTNAQYPALDYGLTASAQRAAVTVAVSPTSICESSKGTDTNACGASPVTSSTLTATLSPAQDVPITLAFNTNTAVYTLKVGNTDKSEITIAAGSTSGTITVGAVNNKTDASDASVTLTPTSAQNWVNMPSGAALTIKDEDILAKPTGMKAAVAGTKVRLDWSAVTGATGYTVQWHTADTWSSPTGTATITSGATTTHSITTGLISGTKYWFRVIAVKTGYDDSAPSESVSLTPKTGNVDYDANNDGLIEIKNLAQLNAVRWDLNGDGEVDSSGNATAYSTAFPDAEDNMGCGESAVTISSNDTGNPTCSGYELAANLDFDTDGSGGPNSGDTYWNSGAGWTPIGDATTGYTGEFDGNRSSYKISNLHINSSTSTAGAYAGLFGVLGTGAVVKEVLLSGASVTATGTSSDSTHTVYAGALAGKNSGTVTDSRSVGAVAVVRTPSSTGYGYAGGLVGWNDGTVRASYSRAAVTATANKSAAGHAGGLVGLNDTGATIAASFATGDVTATTTDTGTLQNSPHTGGLVSENKGTVIASYAHGAGTVKGRNAVRGGLAAVNDTGATITASYSTGGHTGTGTNSTASGGLAGTQNGTVTASYWDTDTSSVPDDADTNPPEGKTTSALQTPTAYGTGIYQNWNVNVDGVAGNDSPWNFGTSAQYPVLVHGGLTAADQRAAVTVSLSPTSICESAKGSHANACGASPATTSTLTATLSPAQEVPVTLAFNTNAAVYTLKVGGNAASQITIAAGSTSGAITVEAVNNKTDASDLSVTLTPTASGRVWISMPAGATLTIKDEDILTKPTGVKVSVDGTKAQVDWTAVTDATGYTVQWSTSATFAGSPSSATSTTTSHKITSG